MAETVTQPDPVTDLYKTLRKNGISVPENPADFRTMMQDQSTAFQLHSFLKKKGKISVPVEFSDFYGILNPEKKKTFEDELAGEIGTPNIPLPSSQESLITSAPPGGPEGIDLSNQLAQDLVAAGKIRPEAVTDFGTQSLEEIEAGLRDEMNRMPPSGFVESPISDQVEQAFDRPVEQRKPTQLELDEAKFESKKEHLKDLIREEDKAIMAEKLQKKAGDLLNNLDKEIANIESQPDYKRWDTLTGGKGPGFGLGSELSEKGKQVQMLEMAKDILQYVKNTPDEGDFLEGLASKGLVHSLPFIGAIADIPQLVRVMEATKGTLPTEILDEDDDPKTRLATADAIRKNFEAFKEQPSGYRAGQILAEMIPYMGEFAMTLGSYSVVKTASTTALMKGLGAASSKKAVQNAVIKPVSSLLAVAAQASANPQRYISNAIERMTPQMQIALSLDEGEINKVIKEGGEGFNEAFAKAFGTNAMEILTERFGKWIPEGAQAIGLSRWLPNITLGKWMEKRGITDLAKAGKIANTIGWNGMFKEIWLEEYPNKLLQNAITGDQQWSPDFFNPLSQEFIDMVIPSAIISGVPLGVGVASRLRGAKGAKFDDRAAGEMMGKGTGDLGKLKTETEELKKQYEKPKEPTRQTTKTTAQPTEVEEEKPLPVQAKQEEPAEERVTPYSEKELREKIIIARPSHGETALTDKGKEGDFIENSEGGIFQIKSMIESAGADSRYQIVDQSGQEYVINARMGDFYTTNKTFEDADKITSTVEVSGDEKTGPAPQVAEGEPAPVQEVATQKEKSGDVAQEEVVRKISEAIGKEKLDKRKIEVIGKEAGIEDKNEVKELSELAVVQKARELAKKDDFDGLVKLYNDQPNLTHRTSESIAKQQYSTPAPIAYLGGKYIQADKPGKKLEPSAGNGMLTIVGSPKEYTVNEIDEVRLRNLGTQGFGEVLNQDASQELGREKQYDAVITNPPFGGTQAIDIEGYKFNELAQIMAVRALNSMKDNGKGFIIIGGNNEFDDKGRLKGRDRIFFNYLFNHYNVDDVIDIAGDIYRKQGASFPIRAILVNGRKAKPEGAAPLENWFGEQESDFEGIKNRIQKFITDEDIQSAELERGSESPVPGQSERVGEPSKSGTATPATGEPVLGVGQEGGPSVSEPTGGRPVRDTGAEQRGEGDSGVDPEQRTISEPPVRQRPAESISESSEPGVSEPGVQKQQPRADRKVAEGVVSGGNVDYQPVSKGPSLNLKSPAGMAQEVLDAQTQLENDVGDVDEFVREKLGYKYSKELHEALSAEQIDAVALAIRNVERGTGIIIGDQAGIGKGRTAAAIIRYANKQGTLPIFISENPGLFSDMWRDLIAIGHGDIKPFFVNSYTSGRFESVIDTETGVLYHKAPRATDAEWRAAIKTAKLPDGTDVVMTTYSQFANAGAASDKINFLRAIVPGSIIVMDEAHKASGSGNTGSLFQQILPEAKGVVFLSATFAKRPDNMPLYSAKTAMSEANMSSESMVTAIESGGVALQEIIASQLSESGEMVRRQRSFDGIEVMNYVLGGDNSEVQKTHHQASDNVTGIIRDIIAFQRDYVKPMVSQMDKDAAQEGEAIAISTGTNMAGVDNYPYFSKVFNVINQLLYSIKAKDTAKYVVDELKAGRKPFVAIRGTLEAMLTDLMDRGVLKIGDAIDPDFRFILKKGLEGVMRITIKDAHGKSSKRPIEVGELSMGGQLAFRELASKIDNLHTGLSISPIDELTQEIEKAGYKVGEITGRKLKLKFKGGKAIIEARKKEPTNVMYSKYNNGDFDVIIVNSSGSTGASAQSSPKFKDQRQRSMVILEPELNISTLVQLLGRVNRTGQISLPSYTFISSSIPAEQRLQMMTMRKLKSLDANTSSNQKQSKSILEVPEIFNKYGDQVVVEYLQENPEIIELISDPLGMLDNESYEPSKKEGAATKVTGRIATLSVAEQERFYKDITERYQKLLDFLNEAGMNDLEVKLLPLKAKPITKQVKILGKGGRSKFGTDTFLEKMEVNVLKKPMTKKEIDETTKDLTNGDPNINRTYIEQATEFLEKQRGVIVSEDEKNTAQRIESIKRNAKLSETEKEDRIKDLQETSEVRRQNKIEKEEIKIKKVTSLLNFFKPGRAIKVPQDLAVPASTGVGLSDGLVLGFDINLKKDKPFLPSNVTLKVAVNDSRRLLSIPGSRDDIMNAIRANSYDLSDSFQRTVSEKWDELKKPKARTIRHFATGNILQGLGDPSLRGPIVKFTTEGGFIETGIMLPESFDPNKDVSKTISVPAVKAAPIILSSDTGSEFKSTDNIWNIKRETSQRFELRVPKSKQTGGKYFMDADINDLIDRGRWDSSGNQMVATTDETRLDEILDLLTRKFGTAFNMETSRVEEALTKQEVDFSKRSASTFEDLNMAMAAPFPVMGKLKKKPQNTELLEKLRNEIKFPEEQEKRFQDAGKPAEKKNEGLGKTVLDFIGGFTSHFKYLKAKDYPREANLLRVFESIKKYTSTRAMTYVKGLTEPLTPEQYDIMRRRIILEDLIHSIERGENMQGLDGTYPFGFQSKEQIQKALDKLVDLSESDSQVISAYEGRNAYMKTLENALINAGLLKDHEREAYYHRRILAYLNDSFDRSVIYGRHLGKKTRNWQRARTGSKGMDYSTHFIETEYKVVTEALYELEKHRILNELMGPFDARLRSVKNEFNKQFQAELDELIDQYGEISDEVAFKRAAKHELMMNYIDENLPEDYVLWQPDPGNALFFKKNVAERHIEAAHEKAMEMDMTGFGEASALIDGLMNDLEENLMVGPKRKRYMVPKQLAEQLDYMGRSFDIEPMTNLVTQITGAWKIYVLLNPNRLIKYNLNNFFGDTDGTLAADPSIFKFASRAWREVYEYKQTGKATPEMLEALREGVIDSGWELSELSGLSNEKWVKFLISDDNGPSLDEAFGKKWLKSSNEAFVQRPANFLKSYFDWAKKWTSIRENTLRYAAYLRAKEKVEAGDTFYWASDPKKIDAIPDATQRAAKLAREVLGDYGNISLSGQQLRRILIPFISWMEINMKRYYRLFKNASSPATQRAILASGLRRGIPAIAIRMLYSYALISAMTALVEAWNYLMFPDEAEKLRRTNVRGMQFILAVTEDGKVISIPIVGALYDAMDFFGIPDVVDAFAMILNGTAPKKGATEAGKVIGWSVANKVFQQTTPLLKYPAEALTGLQFFPDASNPRPIHDYGGWAANIFSARDEYRALMGYPTRRPYFPGHLQRMVFNELDPEELAYYAARRIIQDYTGKKFSVDPTNPVERAKRDALYRFGLALRYGQEDEANKYLIEYILNGGTRESLRASIRSKNPFGQLKKVEMVDLLFKLERGDSYKPDTYFVQSLTPKELSIMKDALRYYERQLGN